MQKKVPLNSIFDVSYGNKFDLNKMKALQRGHPSAINFVGRSSQNHGVSALVQKVEGVLPFPAGLITVALGGTKLLSSFVQQQPFYTAQNVAVLTPLADMSFDQLLYVCLCIRHNRSRYSAFGREANRTIRELLVPKVSAFPEWLQSSVASGQAPIKSMLAGVVEQPTALRTASHEQALVSLEELFDVQYGTNLELNVLTPDQSGINFVSRTSKNNGVSSKVAKVEGIKPIDGGVLTVAGGGSVLETFLQTEEFYSGRDLYYLRPISPMSDAEMLFYCTCIRANMYRYSYGRQANRTLRHIRVPALGRIPSWVRGSVGEVAEQLGKLELSA